MPLIAPPKYKTKKSLREAIKEGEKPYFINPSVFGGSSGTAEQILESKDFFTATNHPKRSWFAHISRNKRTGKITVK